MEIKAELMMIDLNELLQSKGIIVSQNVLDIFWEFECLCYENDKYPFYHYLLLPLIKRYPQLQDAIQAGGGDYKKAIQLLENNLKDFDSFDGYDVGEEFYSSSTESTGDSRTNIIRKALEILEKNNSKVLSERELLFSILDYHDQIHPIFSNGDYIDERLCSLYHTLAHLISIYDDSLWVKFEFVRKYLNGHYDMVISFAGEDREHAKYFADELTKKHYRIFYDEYSKSDLWGKDLYTHLNDIYTYKGRFCLMLISEQYAKKQWTNHERRAAQARAFRNSSEYILPLKLDDTIIPGVLETTGYIDFRNTTKEEVLELICEKLEIREAEQGLLDPE
ncbi:TIR domain-containing protein [Paenibacillus xylanexedens]|uniref:TIR domain-containing protein n=1 Tax=Paenibacillus xylanexedens TaxID=528191 RepID=UPI001F012EFD|nr:TIR domain-containing protein [Paenibacillus xylanexedens]MCF7755846.1 TIR domain-containing protein [Paenibacillus xylanexedens]